MQKMSTGVRLPSPPPFLLCKIGFELSLWQFVKNGLMKEPFRVIAVKGREISTYRLTSGRCMVVWDDSEGRRQRRSRPTLKEADELVGEVSGALQAKINGAMTLDDRQAYNLARELVEPFG